jgi:hypothetical protein
MRKWIVAAIVTLPLGALRWLYRTLFKSVLVRLLASARPNAAKRHGLRITFRRHRGRWIRLALQADLGPTLSEVVGYPVEAAATSRFGGFVANRPYSEFQNPDSPYYQAWLGAYVVFDSPQRQHFGFDEEGQVVLQEALDVLEADQRLVYHGAGCDKQFPDGHRVQPRSEFAIDRVDVDGETWWRVAGQADTWSVYHRGVSPEGSWHHPLLYGTVPPLAAHPVEDFHPLTYHGEFWMRYAPEVGATCARFFIYPEYVDRDGVLVTKGQALVAECRALLRGIAFESSGG